MNVYVIIADVLTSPPERRKLFLKITPKMRSIKKNILKFSHIVLKNLIKVRMY